MIKGLITLLLFQLLGETITSLSDAPIPGPVAGMVLLFVALSLRQKVSHDLNRVSHDLIQNLSLLFLPAGVGIFFLPESVQGQWPAILGAIAGGTFISMMATAWLVKTLAGNRRQAAGEDR